MNKLNLQADVTLLASDEAVSAGEPVKFSMEAYTGNKIRQAWSREPIVIDLAGMELKQQIPIVLGHDYEIGSILGQTTSVRVEAGKLLVEGEILADSEKAQTVEALARKGYKWQASVGADVTKHVRLAADGTTEVNGATQAGPLRIVKASNLREVSFVTLGADSDTAVSISADMAEGESSMAKEDAKVEATEPQEPVAVEAAAEVASVKEEVAEVNTEALEASLAEVREELKTMRELVETRESRAPAIHASATPQIDNAKVDEAALCLQAGLDKADGHYDEQTLEAAHKIARTHSLGEVLVNAARSNGYDGSARLSSGNVSQVLKAAFATHSITDILSNVANKFLLSGFTAVEQVWQNISSVRSVNDFKSVSMFRLNGSFKFQKVGNGGTLQMANASDEKRTVNADTYGIMTNISRQDLINDDLNALSAVNNRIGRGAALSMNDVIWGEFQSGNASYYSKATAGSGNALSLSSLKSATTAFRKLKDPDGNPIGVAPKILVVPPDLELAAAELMTSSLLITGEDATKPAQNVLSGRYRVVVSSDLTSATTWWLAAEPGDLNALDVVFLNGQQSPTIEQVDMDAAVMGITLRGYCDFGVSKAEGKACYRMATS